MPANAVGQLHHAAWTGGYHVLGWDRSATTINPKQDPSDENYIDWVTKRGQLEAHKRDFGGSHDADLMSHIAPLLTQKRCGNDIYN